MSFGVFAGIALVVGLILTVGLLSGRRVKDSSDFLSGSGKAGTFLVAGAIMGSLVGSQSTMGTAQLSFQFGFSGWWFTLGCCFGCVTACPKDPTEFFEYLTQADQLLYQEKQKINAKR